VSLPPCLCPLVLAVQVDSDYLKQTRARLAAAAKPVQKRKVAILEDDHEINQLAGGTKDLPLYVKNRQVRVGVGGAGGGGVLRWGWGATQWGRVGCAGEGVLRWGWGATQWGGVG
jgi:hypothetical protein